MLNSKQFAKVLLTQNLRFKKLWTNLLMTLVTANTSTILPPNVIIWTGSCGLPNQVQRIDWLKSLALQRIYRQRNGEFNAVRQLFSFTNVCLCLNSPKFSHQIPKFTYFAKVFPFHTFWSLNFSGGKNLRHEIVGATNIPCTFSPWPERSIPLWNRKAFLTVPQLDLL